VTTANAVSPDALAYVNFTSGSTGRAQGVMDSSMLLFGSHENQCAAIVANRFGSFVCAPI